MKPIALALLSMLVASPAFAGKERCKDVEITVENDRDEDIKVIDIKYWDSTIGTDGDWRNENGVKGKKVRKKREGKPAVYVRHLEEVKADKEMKVKVRYKKSDLGKWKDPVWSGPSAVKTCFKGQKYTVVVN